jgi:dihydrofolate reductase
MSIFTIIYAVDANNGFGTIDEKTGKPTLAWKIPQEMALFRKLSTVPYTVDDVVYDNNLIMGRVTYESMPSKLPKRRYIVVTSQKLKDDNVITATSLDEALKKAAELKGNTFVIGGTRLIEEAYQSPLLDKVYQTKISKVYPCKTFMKDLSLDSSKFSKETQTFHVVNPGEELLYDLNTYSKL